MIENKFFAKVLIFVQYGKFNQKFMQIYSCISVIISNFAHDFYYSTIIFIHILNIFWNETFST